MHYARGYRQETIIHQDGKLRVIRNHRTRPEPAILVKIICPSDEQRVRGGRCDWSGMGGAVVVIAHVLSSDGGIQFNRWWEFKNHHVVVEVSAAVNVLGRVIDPMSSKHADEVCYRFRIQGVPQFTRLVVRVATPPIVACKIENVEIASSATLLRRRLAR
jgi:hypothetical protein